MHEQTQNMGGRSARPVQRCALTDIQLANSLHVMVQAAADEEQDVVLLLKLSEKFASIDDVTHCSRLCHSSWCLNKKIKKWGGGGGGGIQITH